MATREPRHRQSGAPSASEGWPRPRSGPNEQRATHQQVSTIYCLQGSDEMNICVVRVRCLLLFGPVCLLTWTCSSRWRPWRFSVHEFQCGVPLDSVFFNVFYLFCVLCNIIWMHIVFTRRVLLLVIATLLTWPFSRWFCAGQIETSHSGTCEASM